MAKKHGIAKVGDIVAVMEAWAPAVFAEPWDQVGLLAGDASSKVAKALVALELTPGLLSHAQESGAAMLLTHHPPLFKPLKALRMDQPATARLVRAAASGLALFAAHTNLDSAPHGVSDALAARLSLTDTQVLAPGPKDSLLKLVTFAPADVVDAIADALFEAGAGQVGGYVGCAFQTGGNGRFTAPKDGKPYLGRPGQAQRVAEERLETWLPKSASGAVLAALHRAHPYEQPAYDLLPLTQAPAGFGLGRVGNLPSPMAGEDFVARAAKELGTMVAQVAGPLSGQVKRVAVIGGSGGDFLAAAAGVGAQVLITGEARYHAAEEAADLGVALVCLGHYQTEAVIVKPWAKRLGLLLEGAGYNCEVQPWTGGADPWRGLRAHKED